MQECKDVATVSARTILPTLCEVLRSRQLALNGAFGIEAIDHFDEKYSLRPDYQLFRLGFDQINFGRSRWSPSVENLCSGAIASLEDVQPEVHWSGAALISWTVLMDYGPELAKQLLSEDILTAVRDWLNRKANPLPLAPQTCALIELAMIGTLEKLRFLLRSGTTVSKEYVKGLLDRLRTCLKAINPNWKTEAGPYPRLHERAVLPLDSNDMNAGLQCMIQTSLYCVRRIAHALITGPQCRLGNLSHYALALAILNWRLAGQLHRNMNGKLVWVGKWRLTEEGAEAMLFGNLQAAAQAAMDAGKHWVNAELSCRLLWSLPDRLRDDEKFRGIGNTLSATVRKAGFGVPQSWPLLEDDAITTEEDGYDLLPDDDDADSPDRSHQSRSDTHYISSNCGVEITQDEELRGFIMNANLRGASVRLGTIARPHPADVLEFASACSRSQQLLPRFVNTRLQSRHWRRVIRESWRRAGISSLKRADALKLHETLLGTCVTGLVQAEPKDADAVLTALYRQSAPQRVAEAVYPDSCLAGKMRQSTVDELQKWIAKQSKRIGPVALASLCHLQQNTWSLIVLEENRFEHFPLEMMALKKLLPDARHVMFHPGPLLVTTQSLRTLAENLWNKISPDTKWLALAIEPRLARLPWNQMAVMAGRNDLLVTLVPSLSWAESATPSSTPPTGELACPEWEDFISEVKESYWPRFRPLWERLRNDISLIGGLEGWIVIAGHGQWRARRCGPVPEVSMGSDAGFDDWLRLGLYRVAAVYSCHAGKSRQALLGDLGGLASLLLAKSCRFFCAPVAEVPPELALILHEHLTNRAGPRFLGDRYREALKAEPKIGAFQVYGLATELASL